MKSENFVKQIHKHVKRHHKKYFLGAGIGFLIFKLITLVVGGVGLLGDNFSKAEWDGGVWNNDVFVDEKFWEVYPDDLEIISAIIGNNISDRTAYTIHWSDNLCNYGSMNVVPINPGTDHIGSSLSSNTIYVLESGNYITNNKIWIDGVDCVAILGKGEVNIFSSVGFTGSTDGMVNMNIARNIIFDNINVNGSFNGEGGEHPRNRRGIYSLGNILEDQNITFNNIQIYNNKGGIYFEYISNTLFENMDVHDNDTFGGISVLSSSGNKINNSLVYNNYGNGILFDGNTSPNLENSKLYNNTNGAYFDNTSYGTISHSRVYNNTNHGIYINLGEKNKLDECTVYNNAYGITLNTSSLNQINNSKIYNNSGYGVWFRAASNNNSINNSQSYNNTYGISISWDSDNNIINNSQFYNNTYGIDLSGSSENNIINQSQSFNNNYGIQAVYSNGNKYYGILKLFENVVNIEGTGIVAGNAADYAGIGLTTGTINSMGSMDCSRITNPITNGGEYLHTTSLCNTKNKITSRSGDIADNYRYGTNILLQTQALKWNEGEVVLYGNEGIDYDVRRYIGQYGNVLGNFDINNNDISTQDNEVLLNNNIIGASDMNFSEDGTNRDGWDIFESSGYKIISSNTGLKTVYADFKNASGETLMTLDTILLGVEELDIIPNEFSFDDIIDADILTTYQSNSIILDGMSPDAFATVTVNTCPNVYKHGALVTGIITGGNGDQFHVERISPSNYASMSSCTFSFGDVGSSWTIYTKDADYIPNQFTFIDVISGNTNTIYTSNIITLTGMSPGLFTGISINNGNLFKNLINIGTSSTGGNGDQFYIQLSSSLNHSSNVSSTMTIAGVSDNFSILTVDPPASNINRNNDNFIDESFWSQGPNDIAIIDALYGSGENDLTAYTKNRTGNNCNYSSLSVTGLSAGLNKIPNSLSANTVYVLNSGNYNISYTNGIILSGCSTIIGNGDVNIYSSGWLENIGMFNIWGKQNIIIDNISIDGKSDGNGGYHKENDVGINFNYFGENNNINNTINNSQTYNAFVAGIGLQRTSYTTINNFQSYNNDQIGILITQSSNHNVVNNSKIYNNPYGISISTSGNYNSINNSQIYNNQFFGLVVDGYYGKSEFNIINNCSIYNNYYGLVLVDTGNYNIINNSKIYNNTKGIITQRATLNKYYGTITFFGNDENIDGAGLSAGGTEYASIGLAGGDISSLSSNIDCSWITNPISTSGIYLQTGNLCNATGTIGSWTGSVVDNYRYGTNIITQIQPVRRNGSNIVRYGVNGNEYNTSKYIGQYGIVGGMFNVNNKQSTTLYTGVTLYNILSGYTEMNFSNDGINRSGWESFSGTKNWIIDSNIGLKNIYADFSGLNGIFMTMDTISYIIKYDPDQFYFNDITGAETSHLSQSNTIVLTGMSPGVFTSVNFTGTSGISKILYKNGQVIGGSSCTGENGDQFQIWLESSFYENIKVYARLIVGGIYEDFEITTNDPTPPFVYTAYIYSGTTGNNGTTGYYKGIVNIKADIYEVAGISGNTCEYTTGGSWYQANYSGTTANGYCYKTGVVGGSDLNINFRVKDFSNNLGTGTSKLYIYDNTAPTFTFENNAGFECALGSIAISNQNDSGVGLNTNPYSFDGIIRNNGYTKTIPPQNTTGIILNTGYVRDALGNYSYKTGTYTILNSAITSNSFTISTSVLNNTVTGNWKSLSSASDGACGSGDISYSGMITQGIKGNCNVMGDIISYTPSSNKTGSDTCTIQIKDNENSIANVVITWTGINTIGSSAIRNNDNFIDETFWNQLPNDTDIINAIYGSGFGDTTAYTNYRLDNACDVGNLNVQHADEGVDNIPQQLMGNTIYVLNPGNYKISYPDGIFMENCSAIIGNGDVSIYSTVELNNNVNIAMIAINGKQHTIVDNINIDGISDGNGGNHQVNRNGIILNGAINNSINNTRVYNNKYMGIYLTTASNNIINNSQIYNNDDGNAIGRGMRLIFSSNDNIISNSQIYGNGNGIDIWNNVNSNDENIINNSQIYNNKNYGIRIDGSSYNTVNNAIIYNNYIGIYLANSSGYNSINNSQVYNNDSPGIFIYRSNNNNINNSQFYNNLLYGIRLDESSNTKINNSKVYNNSPSSIQTGSAINTRYYGTLQIDTPIPSGLSAGTGIYYSSIGRTTGSIITLGSMDCSRISNPITNGGEYLQITSLCNTKGLISLWTGKIADNYRYGTNIFTQLNPVRRSGGNIVLYGTNGLNYNTGRYIGQYGEVGGTFNINNNDEITYTSGITFYSNVVGASFIKFLDPDYGWIGVGYSPIVNDLLEGNNTGVRNIYANYSGTNEIFMALDTIFYDIPDTIPDAFNFINKTGAELNTIYTSNIITIDGMTPGFFTGASLDTGTLFKNGINIGTSGTGGNGDQFYIYKFSSNNYNTLSSCTFNIGGILSTFSITTKDNPGAPVILGASNGAYYSGNINIQISGADYSGTFVNGVWNILSLFTLSGTTNSVVTYYLTAYNNAGNYSTINFTIDKQAPSTVDNTSSNTSSGDQTIILTGTDNGVGIANTFYCIDNVGGTCTPNIAGTSVFVTGANNSITQKIVRYFSRDSLGNTESIKTSLTINIDKQSPQAVFFNINNGATYTTGVNITLTNITGTDSRSPIQIAYGTSVDVSNRSSWSASKSFVLDNVDGLKTIYMRFRDVGGNITIISGSITLDASIPVITIINPNSSPATGKTITAITNEGILTMTTGSTNPACDASRNFVTYASTTFTSEPDNGKYVCYRAIDNGGNISYSGSNIIGGIDTSYPTMTVVSPSANVGTTGVLLYINTNENTECRYSSSAGINFTSMILLNGTGTSHTGNYTASQGINNIYFKCKDLAGNISGDLQYTFTVDTVSPVANFINPPAAYTNNSGVNISITGSNISAYKYKLVTGNSCVGINYSLIATGNLSTNITEGPSVSDQQYSYCVIGYNVTAGRNTSGVNKHIFVYDNTAPVITVVDGANSNRNTGDNINLNVNYNLAGVSGTRYIWNDDLDCNGLNYLSGTNYTAGTNILVNNESYNGKYLCFRSVDLAGNITYTGVGTLKIDKTAPTTNVSDALSGRRNTNVLFLLTGRDKALGGAKTLSNFGFKTFDSYSSEMVAAYNYAFANGLTTLSPIENANVYAPVIRNHFAKMIGIYAKDIMGLTPDTGSSCQFSDLGGQTAEMENYITEACQLGLMGVGTGYFHPNDSLIRAEFATALSRALRGDKYNGGTPYYIDHLMALQDAGIINNIENTGTNEIIGYVRMMMQRADENGVGTPAICRDPMVAIACALDPEDNECPVECRENFTGVGLNTTYYKILTGDVSCSAGNYLTYTGSIGINANTGETIIKSVCYYAVDNLGNTENYKKQLYKIDKQNPSINLLSPLSGSTTSGGISVNFVWSGIENGIGISGYIFRLYNQSGVIITGINTSLTSINITNLLNGKYLRNIEGMDLLGNTETSNTQSFVNINKYVILPPTSGLPEFISEFTGKDYNIGTGSNLFNSGDLIESLVGTREIYYGYNNEIKKDVIMQSINNTGNSSTIEIKISSGTFISETGINSNACEDVIFTPTFVSNSIAGDLTTNNNVIATLRLGTDCNNVSIRFLNQSGTSQNIIVRLSNPVLSGGNYKIWYSQDGSNWSFLTTANYISNKLEFVTNHMTYFAVTKDKTTSQSNGGGVKLIKDNCLYSSTKNNLPGANKEGIDYSPSYYDKSCGTPPSLNIDGMIIDGIIDGSPYSEELNKAYLFSYRAGVTTIGDINRADMMGGLLRKHMAKMVVKYATNILKMIPDESIDCSFNDMEYEDEEMQEYSIKVCQLGLMGLKSDGRPDSKFKPNGLVTRSQFGTVLSRLLYGEVHNSADSKNRYKSHLQALKNNGIMTKISKPSVIEKRGYVMLMLMRAGIN